MITNQRATRLTAFALISAIEVDLRQEIAASGNQPLSVLSSEAVEAARERLRSAAPGSPETTESLLDFLDFPDLGRMLATIDTIDDAGIRSRLKTYSQLLESKLTAIRNRVCHSRPLEVDDLANLLDFSRTLESDDDIHHVTVAATLARLHSEPSYVLHLQIPDYADPAGSVTHNLPLSEFDDTGFIGRSKDRKDLTRLIKGSHPVITIVGEGGVGKTALALRCLYDILETDPDRFDAIIWVSLKSTVLTPVGVREISNSIGSVLGLVRTTSDALGMPASPSSDLQTLLPELKEYLRAFKVLLAIDNLETLQTDSLRELVSDVPPNSKILITSRVGLGEYEARYKLDELDRASALTLMRVYSRTRNAAELVSGDPLVLQSYAAALFHNPLLIKWFVDAVSRGLTVGALLNTSGANYKTAIRFCFLNLFERMGDAERAVAHVLAIAHRALTHAEIAFVSTLESTDLEWALNLLHQSSIISKAAVGGSNSIALTPIAFEFIAKEAKPTKDFYEKTQAKLRELTGLEQQQQVDRKARRFDAWAIHSRNREEFACGAFLSQAVQCFRRGKPEQSEQLISRAKSVLPAFAENYRIAGCVAQARDDMFTAAAEFRKAVEVDPNSISSRFTLARFLLDVEQNAAGALEEIGHVTAKVLNDPDVMSTEAQCRMWLGDFERAMGIYEGILELADRMPARARLALNDQILECFRRWLERDASNQDWESFEMHLIAAGEHAARVAESGRFDDRFLGKCGDLNKEVVRIPESGVKAKLAGQLVLLLERVQAGVRTHAPHSESIAAQLVKGAQLTAKSTVRMSGVVRKLTKDFGFILADNGRDLFFHSNECGPSQFRQMAVGRRVSLALGENAHGPCAVDIFLID